MSSNPGETDDDDYQNQYEDEESTSDEEQNEVAHLKVDANMSLDELFKLYNKNIPPVNNEIVQDDDEETFTSSDVDDDDDDDDDDSEEEEEDDDDTVDHHQRPHLIHINGGLLPRNDISDDDTDDSSYEPEPIKLINIGDEYQAEIEAKPEYGSSNENCDERQVPVDELLWSSLSVSDADNENIDEYLKAIHTEYPASDDEISLQTLLNCHMDTNLALTKFRQLPIKTIYSYAAWPLKEIEIFEEGLREFGKDFYKISTFKCVNRSVREVVHFYYQWKKSERYPLFIENQRRINSLTSVSDIIEKFIEEQEHQLCTAAGVLNAENPQSFLSNDYKLHGPLSSNSSISFVTIHQQETTTTTTSTSTATSKRSFDQVESGEELSVKKTSINAKTSSTELTSTII